MQDQIRELLNCYQYKQEVKEAIAFRVLVGGEDAKQKAYSESQRELGRKVF